MSVTAPSPARSTRRSDADHIVRARVFAAASCVEGLPAVLARRLAQLLRHFPVPAEEQEATHRFRVVYAPEAGCWQLYRGDERISFATSDAELLALVEWFVIQAGVESCAEAHLIHAAALTRDGATLLIVGLSGAGKTTLTLGLVARGWLPYGDDISPLERTTLQVLPFPRWFHVDDATRALAAGTPSVRWVRSLPGYAVPRRWARRTARPTTIVVVERDLTLPAGARPLLRAEAAGAILSATLRSLVPLAESASAAARLAATTHGCYRINNGDLQTTLDLLETIAGAQ